MTNTMNWSALFLCAMLCVTTTYGKKGTARSVFPIKTLLFKVTSPNTQKTSYLFGTHHAFGKQFFDSLTSANEFLATSDLLIKENLNVPGQMAEDIINHREVETKWNQYLDREDLQWVQRIFASSKMDFNKLTPTELHVFLNRYFKERICLSKDTEANYLSLDDYIGTKAQNLNIPLLGLETTEEQINLINKDVEGMPKRVHKKRLAGIMDKIKSKNKDGCGEVDWYAKMDIDYQWNRPCTNTLILTNRNKAWMKTIESKLQTNNCFIVVGLSHLMYECGLIPQLKALGYTVTPVAPN
ncbi:TraB/GumN family protein [Flagellimonas alvinocaridis]|nr:TraB/GumN family protein [Allomuricauda alvinocaridis]